VLDREKQSMPYLSPLDGQNTKIGGYGDFMARGVGTFSPVECMLAIGIF
jgi:hypothetical protein